MSVDLILYILAAISMLVAACGVNTGRINCYYLSLFLLIVSLII